MKDVDRRSCFHSDAVAKLEARAAGDEAQYPNIVGLAAVYYNSADPGTEFRLDYDFYERILPGAFDRAIREGDDVRALFNHDPSLILGRSSAGTLKLSVDRIGLRYWIDPPETQLGKSVTVAIQRGDVTASSFGFIADEQNHRTEQRDGREVLIRELTSVRLQDVSPVTFPAYPSTGVTLSNRSAQALADFRSSVKAPSAGYPVELARLKLMRSRAR